MLKQVLVFTDMDGTLLDHDNYDYSPALDMLNTLKSKHVPVIPATSKTKAELDVLMAELQLSGPCIVENGAAIYLPQHLFHTRPEGCIEKPGYWVKEFVRPRPHWLDLISKLFSEFDSEFLQFSNMSNQDVIQYTGLDEKSARLANTRLYSEPVKWLGTLERKTLFIAQLQQLGANVLQGGRFLGVSGQCDKGLALIWLVDAYQRQLGLRATVSIALGDSNNDVAMLEASDIAVRIKSPTHNFPTLTRTSGIYDSTLMGPSGWSECLSKILIREC